MGSDQYLFPNEIPGKPCLLGQHNMLPCVTEALELRFLGSVASASSVPFVLQYYSCEQNVDLIDLK